MQKKNKQQRNIPIIEVTKVPDFPNEWCKTQIGIRILGLLQEHLKELQIPCIQMAIPTHRIAKSNFRKAHNGKVEYRRLAKTSEKVNILGDLFYAKTKNELCQQKGGTRFLFSANNLRGSKHLPISSILTIFIRSVNNSDLPAVIIRRLVQSVRLS